MSRNSESKQQKASDDVPKKDGSWQLIISMADTTWRMFTPPALLVPAGIWADLKFGTKPWVTMLSVPVGLAISVLLVKKQLENGE